MVTKVSNHVLAADAVKAANIDASEAAAIRSKIGAADSASSVSTSTANTFAERQTFSKDIVEKKAADVASAATVDLNAVAGNFVHITGTTTITALGTMAAGTRKVLCFDGALTFTHNATSLVLPTGANITTAAGDAAVMVSEGSGNWRCVGYLRASGAPLAILAQAGQTAQVVNTQTGAVATGSTTIPFDDTIPQNTEGDEYMTLAITPTSATSKLRIDVTFNCAVSALAQVCVALFQDSTANALAAMTPSRVEAAGVQTSCVFSHYMTAGTTSATTFKVRAGPSSGTLTFNGSGGARRFGGVMASSITITEIRV